MFNDRFFLYDTFLFPVSSLLDNQVDRKNGKQKGKGKKIRETKKPREKVAAHFKLLPTETLHYMEFLQL